MIKNFKELADISSKLTPVVLTIAAAEEINAAGLVKLAREKGLVKKAILTGNKKKIEKILQELGEPSGPYEIIDCGDDAVSAAEAVKMVRSGNSDILVKGRLESIYYLKAVLDKEKGISSKGLISNLTMLSMPSYHKFICITDNAITPLPDLEQKKKILFNTLPLMKALGIFMPKAAAISALETVNEHIPSTVDADQLKKLSRNGTLDPFIVEGPVSYDIAMSRESADRKNFRKSEIPGDPDILLMPNIESANILVKSCKLHGQAASGGMITGVDKPVILNSRSDGPDRRLNSLYMAMAVSKFL